MARPWVWLQLILGWLPVWGIFVILVLTNHADTSFAGAALIGARAIGCAALLGLLVHRFTERVPWPQPVRVSFVATHLLAAVVFAASWFALTATVEALWMGAFRDGNRILVLHIWASRYLVLGVWLYVIVAGVTYANQAAARAARAEALAARSQLAALKAQLNPHFLFNALHTVVHLIPLEPLRAAQAAEQLAGLLRTTIEEDRDLVTLAEERVFVERYLEIERIRFGDRLRVDIRTDPGAEAALLPCFALQTLVENAVRHGAAPRVEPTGITIEARLEPGVLRLSVLDTGAGATPVQVAGGGTGLSRLRERLAALYGSAARLEAGPGTAGGFFATLRIPQPARHES
ncbi:MAG TPA: histidine kinase [Gemmatimonadales bacterium]|nr:histidine kinase [Gemmatimonadales bacterium]